MSPNITQYLCPTRLNNATLFLYGQLSAMLGQFFVSFLFHLTHFNISTRRRLVANHCDTVQIARIGHALDCWRHCRLSRRRQRLGRGRLAQNGKNCDVMVSESSSRRAHVGLPVLAFTRQCHYSIAIGRNRTESKGPATWPVLIANVLWRYNLR